MLANDAHAPDEERSFGSYSRIVVGSVDVVVDQDRDSSDSVEHSSDLNKKHDYSFEKVHMNSSFSY